MRHQMNRQKNLAVTKVLSEEPETKRETRFFYDVYPVLFYMRIIPPKPGEIIRQFYPIIDRQFDITIKNII